MFSSKNCISDGVTFLFHGTIDAEEDPDFQLHFELTYKISLNCISHAFVGIIPNTFEYLSTSNLTGYPNVKMLYDMIDRENHYTDHITSLYSALKNGRSSGRGKRPYRLIPPCQKPSKLA